MQRREFVLRQCDSDCLDVQGLHWESVKEGSKQWLHIYDFPIPPGYNVSNVRLALDIPTMYPEVEIDMAYFFPALELQSGKPVSKAIPHQIDGETFQRWSRHRSAGSWRKDLDGVETHLLYITNWLNTELNK